MDSLLVNYASSDDDDGETEISRPILSPKDSSFPNYVTPQASSFSSFLPPARSTISSSSSPSSSSSSSFFLSSLPSSKSQLQNHSLNDDNGENEEEKPSEKSQSSLAFSFLPPPKTTHYSAFSPNPLPKFQSVNTSSKLSADQSSKKIVHFTPPLNLSALKSEESDSDDDEEERRRKARIDASSSSTTKGIASILPAPRMSLSIVPSQPSGGSRRSSLQVVDSSQIYEHQLKAEEEEVPIANYADSCVDQGVGDYDNYTNDVGNWTSDVVDPGAVSSVNSTYVSNPAINCWEQVNGNNVDYGSYMENSIIPRGERRFNVSDVGRIAGKRGRIDVPAEIVEVKQDELIKNRPREDQVKLTGIAFGPAYQAAPSGKGKPSKLQKRKHQIGSLYYDLKQKEMELAERRSRGLLTKSETQAKYGW